MQSPQRCIRQRIHTEFGQTLVVFTFAIAALVAIGAMVIDAGLAYDERRQAQNAADAAALAAAQELAETGSVDAARSEALNYLSLNGYTVADSDITVNIPPLSGPHQGDSAFVEVLVSRGKEPVLRGVVNDSLWSVGARAVGGATSAEEIPLVFGSLRDDCKNHTLLIDAGGNLIVNGAIYTNSCNLSHAGEPGKCASGDAFDVFGGGSIQAEAIYVVGGWEVDGGSCNPSSWVTPDPYIHQQPIPDPAADLLPPDIATLPVRNGSAAAPSKLTISSGTATLQPGVYYGGITLRGTANVTLAEGIYYIAGGGFTVKESARLTAPHVLIYNSKSANSAFGTMPITTTGSVTLGPLMYGPYRGMTVFQDRASATAITLGPGNGINGLSGTFYAANDLAWVIVTASGTANMNILSGMIKISGADATFIHDQSGLFDSKTVLAE